MKKRHVRRYSELGLETPKTIIPRWVASKGPAFQRKFMEHMVLWLWPQFAGEAVARQVKAMGIRKKTLHLFGENSSMNNQVQMMSEIIVKRINDYAKYPVIDRIYVGRRWEHPDTEGMEEIHRKLVADEIKRAKEHIGHQIQRENLSAQKMHQAEEMAHKVEDEDLQKVIQRVYQHHLQADQLKKKKGWHPCKDCGTLCEPEADYCQRCARKRDEEMRHAIARVLRDIPWARYSQVREYVPDCTPALIAKVREELVLELARKIDVRDRTSLEARTLVMLYRCVPPEYLTEEMINRTLYRLRFNLIIPKDYQMPKRYDIIDWGHPGKKDKA